MSNPLDLFLAEVSENSSNEAVSSIVAPSTSSSSTEVQVDIDAYNYLVVCGCVDFDNMTSKAAAGLDVPHIIPLPKSVSKCWTSSSSSHFFIVLHTGEILAMGKNSNGQLSLGDQETRNSPTLIKFDGSFPVKKIATGRSHTLLLDADGDIYAAGSNQFGQLGLGENGKSSKASTDHLSFKKVTFLTASAKDIGCGYEFSAAVTTEGKLYTWGHPEYGQLGHGSTGEFFKEGKAGMSHSCVYRPQLVNKFINKGRDGRGAVTEYSAGPLLISTHRPTVEPIEY